MMEQVHRKEPQVLEMAAAAVIPEDPVQAQALEPVDKKAHASKTNGTPERHQTFHLPEHPSGMACLRHRLL